MEHKFFDYTLPILKLISFLFFCLISVIPFLLFAQFGLINQEMLGTLGFNIIYQVILLLIVCSALLMTFQVFKTYHFTEVFIVKRNAFSGFSKGALMGLLMIMSCCGLAFLNGNVSFNLGNITLLVFIGNLVFYILIGVFEEFLFRSFPLAVLIERYPIAVALLLNGLLFGLAHLANPGFNGLAMLNISCAGILFSMVILIKKNISWAIGLHFGWNFTQGILLGYKVSGTDAAGILVATPLGSPYLSGGAFGIESSLFCSVILILVIGFLWLKYPNCAVKSEIKEIA